MNHNKFWLPMALAFASLPLQAQDFSTYASLHSISYSDIAPIKQVIDGLEGKPISSGDFAFTHNQAEIGQRWKGFELAFFLRYDYYLEFDKDTAQLVYLDKNGLPLEAGRTYRVDLKGNQLRSKGLGLGYRYQFNNGVQLGGRLNYLEATEMLDGHLRGWLAAGEQDYSGELTLDYGYSEDVLLKRPKESVRGRGFTLDLDAAWQIDQQNRLWFSGRDLYSAIRWKDLTYTTASATSNRISYADDGTLSSIPVVIGMEGYRDQTQRLPRRILLGGEHKLDPAWGLQAELFSYDEHHFPRVAVNWYLPAVRLQAGYDIAAEALGLSLMHKSFAVKLQSDSLDWEKARALELQLSAQVQF